MIPNIFQVAFGRRELITVLRDDYPMPDGTCVQDYLHIDNLASAHLAVLVQLGCWHQGASEWLSDDQE